MNNKELVSLSEKGSKEDIQKAIDQLSSWIEINSATVDELSTVIDLLNIDLKVLENYRKLLKYGISETKARKTLKLDADTLKIAKSYNKAITTLNWNTYCRNKLEESL